jgi:hypothetical protein
VPRSATERTSWCRGRPTTPAPELHPPTEALGRIDRALEAVSSLDRTDPAHGRFRGRDLLRAVAEDGRCRGRRVPSVSGASRCARVRVRREACVRRGGDGAERPARSAARCPGWADGLVRLPPVGQPVLRTRRCRGGRSAATRVPRDPQRGARCRPELGRCLGQISRPLTSKHDKSHALQGFSMTGGGTRTPDTRIMIGALPLIFAYVGPRWLISEQAVGGHIRRVGDQVGDQSSKTSRAAPPAVGSPLVKRR